AAGAAQAVAENHGDLRRALEVERGAVRHAGTGEYQRVGRDTRRAARTEGCSVRVQGVGAAMARRAVVAARAGRARAVAGAEHLAWAAERAREDVAQAVRVVRDDVARRRRVGDDPL